MNDESAPDLSFETGTQSKSSVLSKRTALWKLWKHTECPRDNLEAREVKVTDTVLQAKIVVWWAV